MWTGTFFPVLLQVDLTTSGEQLQEKLNTTVNCSHLVTR